MLWRPPVHGSRLKYSAASAAAHQQSDSGARQPRWSVTYHMRLAMPMIWLVHMQECWPAPSYGVPGTEYGSGYEQAVVTRCVTGIGAPGGGTGPGL